MKTWKDVHFHFWDWKDQPDWKEINELLEAINGPARIIEMDTGSDQYGVVIHPPEFQFSADEWYSLLMFERAEYIIIPEEATPRQVKELFEQGSRMKEEEETLENQKIKEREEKAEKEQLAKLKKKYSE